MYIVKLNSLVLNLDKENMKLPSTFKMSKTAKRMIALTKDKAKAHSLRRLFAQTEYESQSRARITPKVSD